MPGFSALPFGSSKAAMVLSVSLMPAAFDLGRPWETRARMTAAELHARVRLGADPAGEKIEGRARAAETIGAVLHAYLAHKRETASQAAIASGQGGTLALPPTTGHEIAIA